MSHKSGWIVVYIIWEAHLSIASSICESLDGHFVSQYFEIFVITKIALAVLVLQLARLEPSNSSCCTCGLYLLMFSIFLFSSLIKASSSAKHSSSACPPWSVILVSFTFGVVKGEVGKFGFCDVILDSRASSECLSELGKISGDDSGDNCGSNQPNAVAVEPLLRVTPGSIGKAKLIPVTLVSITRIGLGANASETTDGESVAAQAHNL
ncbi:hypothetical protein CROQUDRAFT_99954 [Cronartium quercuum f. sp. fusiforme G11]|uniref:Uncharacterized protein n=1 Tax=Cronartium quercuum f. sp. fusiforme G11 TaxID=708437 RepID=A0A9P6NA58_9BASI|nr:hypothetical protein CROQUDRAFT_99954 [Cronartium quercuum f. sp. fusiforme G11]